MSEKVEVQNVNHPGRVERVDAAKYHAMRRAYLSVLDAAPDGLSHSDAKAGVVKLLPPDLFPAGKAAGWWLKTVQLDLEAKGLVVRRQSKPLTFHLSA